MRHLRGWSTHPLLSCLKLGRMRAIKKGGALCRLMGGDGLPNRSLWLHLRNQTLESRCWKVSAVRASVLFLRINTSVTSPVKPIFCMRMDNILPSARAIVIFLCQIVFVFISKPRTCYMIIRK